MFRRWRTQSVDTQARCRWNNQETAGICVVTGQRETVGKHGGGWWKVKTAVTPWNLFVVGRRGWKIKSQVTTKRERKHLSTLVSCTPTNSLNSSWSAGYNKQAGNLSRHFTKWWLISRFLSAGARGNSCHRWYQVFLTVLSSPFYQQHRSGNFRYLRYGGTAHISNKFFYHVIFIVKRNNQKAL